MSQEKSGYFLFKAPSIPSIPSEIWRHIHVVFKIHNTTCYKEKHTASKVEQRRLSQMHIADQRFWVVQVSGTRFNSKIANSGIISNATSQILLPLELDKSTLSQSNKWTCGLTYKEMKNVWGFFYYHLVMNIPGNVLSRKWRKSSPWLLRERQDSFFSWKCFFNIFT